MCVFQSLQLLSAAWGSFRNFSSGMCDTAPATCAQPLGVTLAAFSHLMGEYREDRPRLLSEMRSERTREKGHKLQQQELGLFMKKFLSRGSVKPCNRRPRGAVESPSFEMFKTWLDIVWAHWSTLAILWAGCWIRQPPAAPSKEILILKEHKYKNCHGEVNVKKYG